MNIPSKTQYLNNFEIEKLCHLLECDKQELEEFEKIANQIADETENTYDAMMKILQKGHNLREAIFIAMIIGRKEGYIQAESDMEEEIKDKLYQAFRGNRNQ
ncbi:MAG: hypothetical protein CMC95_01185 [Flavobacteriales bacterium]|nr:hypothetical protein [Flavobacteriales bacterium]